MVESGYNPNLPIIEIHQIYSNTHTLKSKGTNHPLQKKEQPLLEASQLTFWVWILLASTLILFLGYVTELSPQYNGISIFDS